MRSVVRKWGNSAAIRLPAHLLESTGLLINQTVDVLREDGRIIIQAAQPEPLSLNNLVDAITEDNRHDEADFGPGIDKEVW
ncbi:AbrB/MazE/SpoVT family DNA-binding domain-containing protein [Candidatus Kirkpatrickella diaphorinae]|uniref:AbrB/MazE/SpoVT family DNA-binding domain-containing protein n=1 Tax=Candidatus Kirkpatrickella diaphorinae TaxID=2984322 RepID=A0ABY6GJJ3_9PROT|nr:AbrB/MazE/SpoVT family DNA-binding domain-containing protein [Candidatus Kirkpatrickella diaphorinae]UYH50851.1 AbrB/MazE/SpoVT family DNA-binding domain-containing protein [Candidatus Kirkpatrickella diaphorinae]